MYKLFCKLILIFVFLLAPKPYVLLAQNIKIDKSQWERERRGYDFKKPEKPEKQKKETRETESRDYVPITISPILKWGAIILGIGFLLYLLIKALGLDKSSNFNRQNIFCIFMIYIFDLIIIIKIIKNYTVKVKIHF